MNYPIASFNNLIRNRRSIKPGNYSTHKVDDQIILKMLENANWAPNHALTQPWQFTIFTGNGILKFANFQAETYQNTTAPDQFNPTKYEKLKTTPLKASHLIVITLKRQPSEKLPQTEEVCAVACAVQNMLLTAEAYQIGCYWSTGGLTYHHAMKQFLGIGEADLCLGVVYVGNYDGAKQVSQRTPIEEKTIWVRE